MVGVKKFPCLKRYCAFWVELNCLVFLSSSIHFQISWDLENITLSYHLAKPSKNERKKNIYRYLLDENQLSMSSGLHEFKNDLPDEHFEVGIVYRCQLEMHHLKLSIKWHEAGELETLQLNTKSLYHLKWILLFLALLALFSYVSCFQV